MYLNPLLKINLSFIPPGPCQPFPIKSIDCRQYQCFQWQSDTEIRHYSHRMGTSFSSVIGFGRLVRGLSSLSH